MPSVSHFWRIELDYKSKAQSIPNPLGPNTRPPGVHFTSKVSDSCVLHYFQAILKLLVCVHMQIDVFDYRVQFFNLIILCHSKTLFLSVPSAELLAFGWEIPY